MKNKNTKLIIIIGFVILWEIISKLVGSDIIIPDIKVICLNLIEIVLSNDFIKVVSHSLIRTLIGFFISVFLGITAGLISFLNGFLREFFKMSSKLLASVPTVAIILLILIWLRANPVSILIGVFMVFPIIYETVFSSIDNYDEKIIQMLNLYKVSMRKRIEKIYIPQILMDLSKILSSSISINFKMVIAGEVLSQPKYSIGTKLYFEKTYLNTAGIFSWIIIILFLSFCLEKFVRILMRRIEKAYN